MESALEALQFFANSANSVRVFEALSTGIPTNSGLAEQTGASRSTVTRILNDGESRGWIDSEGSQYELTDEGRIMLEEVRACLRTVEGVQHLGEAIEWLPPPAHSLDYRYFADADLITGTPSNPTEPFDYVAERIRATTEIRTLAWTGVPRLTALINEQALAGQLDCEAVMQASFFDTLVGKPEVVSHWRAPAERGDVWRYTGDVPISMHIVDEAVMIWLGEHHADEVVVRGVVVTEERAVMSWAESLYEEYRTGAELLDPATLPTT
ncbi:transcriptional regulator [Natrinema sp. 1APR25-10V2]|uniref:helix-turn-helix transcriptional regulator n=1 Tax=Natrinema sp. 1APR25-10V2 TaxID=2951081 RepID=UPI002876BA8A|nr:transcriptional regulator [Natrinema sp. 1APR25-10V2]MDS0476836.1 transcriptional regulator [Natrinema sp. 1APR25-10V2]